MSTNNIVTTLSQSATSYIASCGTLVNINPIYSGMEMPTGQCICRPMFIPGIGTIHSIPLISCNITYIEGVPIQPQDSTVEGIRSAYINQFKTFDQYKDITTNETITLGTFDITSPYLGIIVYAATDPFNGSTKFITLICYVMFQVSLD